jgi:S-adenosylmethionine synthetase
MSQYFFTSESVTEGHPDKMADQISDAVLDSYLEIDPASRVACETMITTGLVVLAGEVTSKANLDFQDIVRKKIKEIGYDHSDKGFDCNTCSILVSLDKQSPDISQGVDEGIGTFKEQGAGDQGIMFGYATNETDNFMPLTIDLSHKLAKRLSFVRKEGILSNLRADGKTQVTAEYENDKIKRIDSIVVSSQHAESMTLEQVIEGIREEVIKKVVDPSLIDNRTKYYINPTGRFVIGGPVGDCGLTGRKIIVDTYGGHGAHGGGAFSGKDPSKVDRSAAYAARYIAKNLVAAGVAEKALVQLAYAIGVAEPMSVYVNTYGTSKFDEQKISEFVRESFALKPRDIIDSLGLRKPIYRNTAAYGHFGRENDGNFFTWEALDKVDEIRSYFL